MPPRVRLIPDTSPAHVAQIVEHLREGGLIAYPTETVYGFGSTIDEASLRALAALKPRAAQKAFILLVTDRVCVPGLRWEAAAEALADEFWPGPLTLALPAGQGTPHAARASDGTVAVRSSPHAVPRCIIDELGQPISSTSANAQGEPPALSVDDVLAALSRSEAAGDILVIDGGPLAESPPSTIVSFAAARPRLVRRGAIPAEDIRRVVGDLDE